MKYLPASELPTLGLEGLRLQIICEESTREAFGNEREINSLRNARGEISKMNNMQKIIAGVNSKKGGYCRIAHRRGWLEYLNDGDAVFTSKELKDRIRQVVNENPPRGERLFDLQWCQQEDRLHFTMLEPKRGKLGPSVQPYRLEEALERFIRLSNATFYNQIPIGGGKESIDIGMKEDDETFIFVEVKPWDSNNSPLYALVESLKNLVEYRIILEKGIARIEEYKKIELLVLAPVAYYKTYGLLKSDGTASVTGLSHLRDTLINIGNEFKEFGLTAISFWALPEAEELEKGRFLQKCWEVYDESFKEGTKELVQLSRAHAIPSLERKCWTLLVTTGGLR